MFNRSVETKFSIFILWRGSGEAEDRPFGGWVPCGMADWARNCGHRAGSAAKILLGKKNLRQPVAIHPRHPRYPQG
jgi:hypothetical protein